MGLMTESALECISVGTGTPVVSTRRWAHPSDQIRAQGMWPQGYTGRRCEISAQMAVDLVAPLASMAPSFSVSTTT